MFVDLLEVFIVLFLDQLQIAVEIAWLHLINGRREHEGFTTLFSIDVSIRENPCRLELLILLLDKSIFDMLLVLLRLIIFA